MVKQSQVVSLSLLALSFNGCNPRQRGFKIILFKVLAVICNLVIVFLAVIELFLNWNGVSTVAKVEELPNACLNLSKLICLIYHKKNLLEMVQSLDNFWELDKYGKQNSASLSGYHATTLKFYKMFVGLCLFTCILLAFKPVLVHELAFPGYDVCDMQTISCLGIFGAFQAFHILYQLYMTVMGFDGLFMAFMTHVMVEIELIKLGFQNALRSENRCPENVNRDLAEVIEHHEFTLKFIKRLNHIYSDVIFVQYWASMGSATFSLYMMTRNGIPPDSELLMKYGSYFFNVLVQIGLYCFWGAIIMDQVATVGDAVLSSDWWSKPQTKIRRTLTIVIMRTQRNDKLTVGMMYDLNFITYTGLLRHVMSIYTLLDSLS